MTTVQWTTRRAADAKKAIYLIITSEFNSWRTRPPFQYFFEKKSCLYVILGKISRKSGKDLGEGRYWEKWHHQRALVINCKVLLNAGWMAMELRS
jgi:hypothetical protein